MTEQEKAGAIYVASRASVPGRPAMWRRLRDDDGWQIVSSWIDHAGAPLIDFVSLWDRIVEEIASARKLVLYAERADFPLAAAIAEVGVALGMGKPVVVCLPGVLIDISTGRPTGSWIFHRNIVRVERLQEALSWTPEAGGAPIA